MDRKTIKINRGVLFFAGSNANSQHVGSGGGGLACGRWPQCRSPLARSMWSFEVEVVWLLSNGIVVPRIPSAKETDSGRYGFVK